MSKRGPGRPMEAGSVGSRVVEYLTTEGRRSGSEIRRWAERSGIRIDALNQVRHRLTVTGKLQKTVSSGVYFWEVSE